MACGAGLLVRHVRQPVQLATDIVVGWRGDGGGDVSDYVSCLTSDNPAAASITIEPVDASQWYDNNVNSVHAVRVKKGETLQLKVTVKDANGNPSRKRLLS